MWLDRCSELLTRISGSVVLHQCLSLCRPQVFAVTMKRLRATDIDQEVKERAISCMGHIVCYLGDHLGADVQGVLAIFLERLKNEITRHTAVRTVTLVCASPLKVR